MISARKCTLETYRNRFLREGGVIQNDANIIPYIGIPRDSTDFVCVPRSVIFWSTRQVGILWRPSFENATTALQEAVLAVAAGRIPLPSRDVPAAATSTWWMAAMRFVRTSNV